MLPGIKSFGILGWLVEEAKNGCVISRGEKISDKEAKSLSYNLSKKIQKEMTYPGLIKVVVIRETRSINIAK